MKEIRIHGRGGQGGVTLAKILATAEHLEGRSVQAFGIYAAERSGAPLQAFLRYDDEPIHNPNQIYQPDHIIVLDPTLISPAITSGLKPGGIVLLNSNQPPDHYSGQEAFRAFRIATVDATAIAVRHGLGTRSVPIVNSALSGAAARLFGMALADVQNALETMGFHAGNGEAAADAFEAVELSSRQPPTAEVHRIEADHSRKPGLVEGNTGAPPAIRTGNWASQRPLRENATPPCNFICPAGNDVQGFLDALAHDRVDDALATLLKTTPFPSVCGRVCPGFCMLQCNRIELDGAVNVRALERYAGDQGEAALREAEPRDQHVAVIGSGPAGLSAAWHLARLGYRTTVYEAGGELGGLMRTGIPPYRLPRDVLDREIGRILESGVEAVVNHPVDREELEELAARHDAVLAATGLQRMTALDLGVETSCIQQGLEFLDLARNRRMRLDGEQVIVVGGGNTAVDSARSAFRLGADGVRIVYRRTRDEMPAIPEEVDEALDEGVAIDFLVSPLKLIRQGEHYELHCQRMRLADADSSGRRRPVAIPGSEFRIRCDRVILALGQAADTSLLPADFEPDFERAHSRGNGGTLYAAGDLLTNEGTVTAAIGCGREMALRLHQSFSGERLLKARPDESDVVRADRIRLQHFPHVHRRAGDLLPADQRRYTFDEVRQGLDGAEEAARCLSCGVCNRCDRCVTYCPDGVLRREGDEIIFDYDYCKGCGVCASECSRAAIFMKTG